MFIKIDKRTKEEVIISSTDMTLILERDVKANLVDDTLTDMALGMHEHRDHTATYKYQK
ncbi:MAG: N-carbamoyl-L-amino acid amidohydrolase [Ghiorsea sp.]